MNGQNDDVYDDLQNQIKILDEQMLALHGQRQLYDQLQEFLRSNPSIPDNYFFYYLQHWYSSSMSVAIRKLRGDNSKQSISFKRILCRIKNNPNAISRDRFKGGYKDSEGANNEFDQYAGVRENFLDIAKVESDLVDLETKTCTISYYVDEVLAHHDKKRTAILPTFGDLAEAINCLSRLHLKYLYLLTGIQHLPVDSKNNIEVSISADWANIFRIG